METKVLTKSDLVSIYAILGVLREQAKYSNFSQNEQAIDILNNLLDKLLIELKD